MLPQKHKEDLGLWIYQGLWISYTTRSGNDFVCHIADNLGKVYWKKESKNLLQLQKDVMEYLQSIDL